MARIYNAWIQEQDCRTRIKEIPWEGYHRVSLISSEDLHLLQRISGLQKSKQDQVWQDDTQTYVSLYLRLLFQLSRVDCLQATLVYITDMLNDHEERLSFFIQSTQSGQSNPYDSFTPLLNSPDHYLRLKALSLISTLLGSHSTAPIDVLKLVANKTGDAINSEDPNEQELGIECLAQIIRQPLARKVVWALQNFSGVEDQPSATPDIISSLTKLIKVSSRMSAQQQYQIAFCFWLLSFDDEIANQLNKRAAAIPLLIDLTKNAVKEKVTRVLVATLRNLASKAPEANLGPMLVAGNLLALIQNFSARKWSDDELKEDVQWLKEQLEDAKQKMTTYDEYSTELESGLLRWSPPHTSDEFWSANAERLHEKDFQQLKNIIGLLSNASDPIVLAVAANDLLQYVKHCDVGKKYVERLGGKAAVMNLMTHHDADVKYRALITVQQLISHPWSL
ncbi:hypothetical protein O181_061908 [Austropuccinia psidii MF-1]|uniref:V-type proton ATPase subunit H n=1 Tax=Austropuccinia psidii MF-1 TaxID=1389203 RepID=A0A9Q3ENR9_9BASI|nr:hypothetical protein [Austropuccinia psidii MF-1]